jgi:ABC-type nitrate/sulfonate/bicarbonate transport system substrate-binding protein
VSPMERKWRGRLLAALVGALAVLAIAGCGGSKSAHVSSITVGYGYGFSVSSGPDKIGWGILKNKYGITAKLKDMPSPSAAITALDRGDIQLLNVSMMEIIPAVTAGANMRIVLPAKQYPDTIAVGRPGITSVKQLRGKAFLIDGPEGTEASFTRNLVKRAGLAVSDVSFPALDESPARLVALEKGRAAAATVDLAEYERLAIERKGYTLLGRVTDVQPAGPANIWAVQTSFLEKHRTDVQKIVDALMQGYADAYTPAGRAEFLREAAKGDLKGADPRIAERVYADYTAHHYWVRGRDVYSRRAYNTLMAYWLREGALKKGPAFSDLWDTSFWKKAAIPA